MINKVVRKACFVAWAAPQLLLALAVSAPWILLGWIAMGAGRYYEVGQALATAPFVFGEYLRYIFYKCTLRKVGRWVAFKYGSYCQYRNTVIGNRVLIGAHCILGEVSIGNDVLMGSHVNVLSGTAQHGYSDEAKTIREQQGSGRRMISLGTDVWIGSNCEICADVGDRTVIGVGSLVIKPIAGHGVYVGRPAHLVKAI